MVQKRREYHTGEMEVGQMPPIDLTVGRVPEEGSEVAIDIKLDEFDELAFNEEVMTIRLERSQNNDVNYPVTVTVNGEQIDIPVGVPVKLKRKFVSVLAFCKQTKLSTPNVKIGEETSNNMLYRNSFQRYPFSVIHDPNPRGFDWLTKLLAY